jgi:glycerophosphoryl diester phosphodiesterase
MVFVSVTIEDFLITKELIIRTMVKKSMKKSLFIFYRVLSIAILGSAVLLFISSCQTAERSASPAKQEAPAKKIYKIGHRGAAGLAPENTLVAFARACSMGVDAVELDVLLTADRKAVVHHDFSLKPELTRTPDGQWLTSASPPAIKDLRLVDLKTYDVGRLKPGTRYSRRYPEQQPADGERIPTLREVIRLHKKQCDTATQLWIEIKTTPEKPDLTPSPQAVSELVVKILREEKVSDRARILSFDWRNLMHVQKIAPDIPTVYLSLEGVRLNNIKPGQPGASPWMVGLDIDDFSGSIPRAVQAAGGRSWAPYYKHVTISNIQTAHQLGIQVFVWTPDSRATMKRLIEMGVDGIITNRPDRLRSILDQF